MNEVPRQRWGCLQWGIVIGVVLLLIAIGIPAFTGIAKQDNQARTAKNCAQIILALKYYANENGGAFPDSHLDFFEGREPTANGTFRGLFIENILGDKSVFDRSEEIFGASISAYKPDGVIGSAPRFLEALKPGENHWMMVKGQSTTTVGNAPIVFENTFKPQWPLQWDVVNVGRNVRGRAWHNRTIIIGFVDGSVRVEKVRRSDGIVEFDLSKLFYGPPPPILDIEEK